jgi:hypothetical protein
VISASPGGGLKEAIDEKQKYHTVRTILKYHTVRTILKYHTVRTIPKKNLKIVEWKNCGTTFSCNRKSNWELVMDVKK